MVRRRWCKIFPVTLIQRCRSSRSFEPFMLDWNEVWNESAASCWLDLLEREPVGLDVMEVLKDLHTAARMVELQVGCSWSAAVIEPLLCRILQLLEFDWIRPRCERGAARESLDTEAFRE